MNPVATGIVGTVVGALVGAAYVASEAVLEGRGRRSGAGASPAAPETGKRTVDGGQGGVR